ncbi:MAG TPA: dTDP-glucose 4,6-dehydratase [Verrucomicrobiae bacterium]|nr:dTDP-glucose 4,6-dehydratase [Verrucomicrobiae bacterium]
MRYLITGGAGFIGSNFIHYLFKEHPQSQIINLDKLTYAGNPANVKMYEGQPNYRFVKGDILDLELVDKLVSEVDVVVNFAAETHVDRSILGPAEFVQTNIVGTQILLDAVTKHEKRYHHISTDEVFGSLKFDSPEKFNEGTPYDPSSPYSASKAASDHLARAYHRTYGTAVTLSNCSNNYGPYQFIEKFIPLAIINAINDKPIPLYGDGQHIRDWIHVEDHCKGIYLVITEGKIGDTYLIGGNEEQSNVHIAKDILKSLQKSEDLITFVKDRPGHDKRYAIDSRKIELDLGFTRKYTLEEGLKQTVDWYVHHKQWWEPIINNKEFIKYHKDQYENR